MSDRYLVTYTSTIRKWIRAWEKRQYDFARHVPLKAPKARAPSPPKAPEER